VYCCLAGTFPFNSFLSGFISTVGSFVLGGKLNMYSEYYEQTCNSSFEKNLNYFEILQYILFSYYRYRKDISGWNFCNEICQNIILSGRSLSILPYTGSQIFNVIYFLTVGEPTWDLILNYHALFIQFIWWQADAQDSNLRKPGIKFIAHL